MGGSSADDVFQIQSPFLLTLLSIFLIFPFPLPLSTESDLILGESSFRVFRQNRHIPVVQTLVLG